MIKSIKATRIRRGILILIVLFLLLLRISLATHTWNTLPDATDICFVQPVPYSLLESSGDETAIARAYSQEAGVLRAHASSNPIEVEAIQTTDKYDDIFPLALIRGSYFLAPTYYNNIKSIVISEDLSISLFLTVDCIGASLWLDDNEYSVCGIYRSDHSIPHELSTNGVDRVYTSHPNPYDSKYAINGIIINTAALGTLTFDYTSVSDYKTMDYSNMRAVLRQQGLLLAFFTTILAGVCFFKGCVSHHFSSRRTVWIIKAAIVIAFGAATIVLFSQFTFPGSYLPPSGIFDFHHYLSTFIGQVQIANATSNPLGLAYSYTVLFCAALDGILLLIFGVCASGYIHTTSYSNHRGK